MNKNLRPATLDDCKLLFDWANDSEVRKASFSTKQIEWNEHVEWFQNKIKNPECHIFILFDSNSLLGQIRFDLIDSSKYLIDFSIDVNSRGKSLGAEIIKLGIIHLSELLGFRLSFVGNVKKNNVSSRKAFERNHFNLILEAENALTYQKEV